MKKRLKTQVKKQNTNHEIEEALKNIGFEKKDDKFYIPKDEKGNIMEARINDDTLEIIVENKKRNVSGESRISLDKIKEDLSTLDNIEDATETGLRLLYSVMSPETAEKGPSLDAVIMHIAESALQVVNAKIECIDIERMREIKFENDFDFTNLDVGKAAETGNKILELLKETGAKDAYMSGGLAMLLSNLPCYEAVKVSETDNSVVDKLIGSVSGVNVHAYIKLSWDDNTIYYK